jgi:hypothetical protein
MCSQQAFDRVESTAFADAVTKHAERFKQYLRPGSERLTGALQGQLVEEIRKIYHDSVFQSSNERQVGLNTRASLVDMGLASVRVSEDDGKRISFQLQGDAARLGLARHFRLSMKALLDDPCVDVAVRAIVGQSDAAGVQLERLYSRLLQLRCDAENPACDTWTSLAELPMFAEAAKDEKGDKHWLWAVTCRTQTFFDERSLRKAEGKKQQAAGAGAGGVGDVGGAAADADDDSESKTDLSAAAAFLEYLDPLRGLLPPDLAGPDLVLLLTPIPFARLSSEAKRALRAPSPDKYTAVLSKLGLESKGIARLHVQHKLLEHSEKLSGGKKREHAFATTSDALVCQGGCLGPVPEGVPRAAGWLAAAASPCVRRRLRVEASSSAGPRQQPARRHGGTDQGHRGNAVRHLRPVGFRLAPSAGRG